MQPAAVRDRSREQAGRILDDLTSLRPWQFIAAAPRCCRQLGLLVTVEMADKGSAYGSRRFATLPLWLGIKR